MTAPARSPLALASLLAAPTRGRWLVLCGVLLGFGGLALDLPKEKTLLPLGRLTRSVEPGVSGLTRTPEGSDDLRSRVSGKVGLEAHGWSIPGKEMSAMQKKELAKCLHCRHTHAVMNTTSITATAKLREHGLVAYTSASIAPAGLTTVMSGRTQCTIRDNRSQLMISGTYRDAKGNDSEVVNMSIARADAASLRRFAKKHGITLS